MCRNKLSVPLTVVTIFFHSMYNKTIIRFGSCDIQDNQGLAKGYQPQPSPSADNNYFNLHYSGYHKNLISSYCLLVVSPLPFTLRLHHIVLPTSMVAH